MRILRALGVLFAALGLGVLAADLVVSIRDGTPFRLTALGEWWFWFDKDSLQVLQPAIERHLSPALWDPGVQTLLEWPLSIEALVLGAVLILLSKPWRRLR